MEKGREAQKEILLIPLGKVLVDILEEIAVALRKTYQYHVRIGRAEEPDTAMYSDERRQFNADPLLQLVASRKREALAAVLGIVDADMFAGDKSFTFGVHLTARSAAVIALARLRESFYKKPNQRELFLRRAVKEAIFQVGMAMGMAPCAQRSCILHPTSSLWKLDEKGQALCPACRAAWLARLTPAPAAKSELVDGVAPDEDAPAGPEAEPKVPPRFGARPSAPQAEDETEVKAEMIEPENPVPAEEAAVRPEPSGPEEPLIADR